MCCMVLKFLYIFVMQITVYLKVVFKKKFYTKCNETKIRTSYKQKSNENNYYRKQLQRSL